MYTYTYSTSGLLDPPFSHPLSMTTAFIHEAWSKSGLSSNGTCTTHWPPCIALSCTVCVVPVTNVLLCTRCTVHVCAVAYSTVAVQKAGEPSAINFDDIFYGTGLGTQQFYFSYLQPWNIILASSSTSNEIAVLAKEKDSDV